MRYLVTGAAGFIGAHLSSSLAKDGHTVVGIDTYNDYYSPDLKRARVEEIVLPTGVEVIELNLEDDLAVNLFINKFMPDKVYHFAAQPGVRLQVKDYSIYVNRNIVGFSNLIRSCVINQIPDFIYASSSSVYGNPMESSSSEKSPFLNPVSFYGATKLAGEILVSSMVKNSQTRARGLRLFTVYGPWGRPDMAYFRLLTSLLTDYPFQMFGDGSIRRDFTNISDITKFTSLLSTELSNHEYGFHDVVNIGGGNSVSLINMIETFEEIIGKKIILNNFDRNLNDVNFTNANPNYLESLVGSKPEIRLYEGLSEVFKWASTLTDINQLKYWSESVN